MPGEPTLPSTQESVTIVNEPKLGNKRSKSNEEGSALVSSQGSAGPAAAGDSSKPKSKKAELPKKTPTDEPSQDGSKQANTPTTEATDGTNPKSKTNPNPEMDPKGKKSKPGDTVNPKSSKASKTSKTSKSSKGANDTKTADHKGTTSSVNKAEGLEPKDQQKDKKTQKAANAREQKDTDQKKQASHDKTPDSEQQQSTKHSRRSSQPPASKKAKTKPIEAEPAKPASGSTQNSQRWGWWDNTWWRNDGDGWKAMDSKDVSADQQKEVQALMSKTAEPKQAKPSAEAAEAAAALNRTPTADMSSKEAAEDGDEAELTPEQAKERHAHYMRFLRSLRSATLRVCQKQLCPACFGDHLKLSSVLRITIRQNNPGGSAQSSPESQGQPQT